MTLQWWIGQVTATITALTIFNLFVYLIGEIKRK